LIERAVCLLGLLEAFVGVLQEPVCVSLGHRAGIMRKGELRSFRPFDDADAPGSFALNALDFFR
jgi:hypothetical protein